jgi:FKBP-type peptidyl-prolyl cis-trans isomerase FklB
MMKIRLIVILGIFLWVGQAQAADDPVLKSQKDKVSYIIGLDIGKTFKNQGVDIDPDLLVRGLKDTLGGKKPILGDQEIQETMGAFQKEMMAKQEAQAKKAGEKNKKEGDAFLAENKKKEGVKILPSGLQYKVIKAGSGKKATINDTVTAHYRGTLIDGTEFDSSIRRGKPASFAVNGVIPGWTEALQLMEEGAKWQLFIPANLAYGERGAGREIGPNAALIFEVELISVQEKK